MGLVWAGGIEKLKERVTKRKGRGFNMENPRPEGAKEVYDRIDFTGRGVDEFVDMSAQRCKKKHNPPCLNFFISL